MTPYHFPALLALHTMLTRMGVDARDIYYLATRDRDGHECVGIQVRPKKYRGDPMIAFEKLRPDEVATFAMEELGTSPVAWHVRLGEDGVRWNSTSQEERETFMNASPVRGRAIEIAGVLAMKGLLRAEDIARSV